MQGFGGHGVKFGAHLFNELALSIKPFANGLKIRKYGTESVPVEADYLTAAVGDF